jgi:hypothetical protein
MPIYFSKMIQKKKKSGVGLTKGNVSNRNKELYKSFEIEVLKELILPLIREKPCVLRKSIDVHKMYHVGLMDIDKGEIKVFGSDITDRIIQS